MSTPSKIGKVIVGRRAVVIKNANGDGAAAQWVGAAFAAEGQANQQCKNRVAFNEETARQQQVAALKKQIARLERQIAGLEATSRGFKSSKNSKRGKPSDPDHLERLQKRSYLAARYAEELIEGWRMQNGRKNIPAQDREDLIRAAIAEINSKCRGPEFVGRPTMERVLQLLREPKSRRV